MQRHDIFNAVRMDKAFEAFNCKTPEIIGGVPQ